MYSRVAIVWKYYRERRKLLLGRMKFHTETACECVREVDGKIYVGDVATVPLLAWNISVNLTFIFLSIEHL